MIDILISMIFIVAMTMCSKYLRILAFGRAGSVSLELCICAFLYNLIIAVSNAPDWNWFFRNELMRCGVLLLFALVVAALHRYNKELCMAKVDQMLMQRKTVLLYTAKERGRRVGQSVEEVVLDNAGLLARASIDMWYSQFVDKLFYRFLKRTDSGDMKRSFRKKKSVVRWAFADLINSLDIDGDEQPGVIDIAKLDDKSFNIPNKRQIVSMVIFDTMELLALLVAVRVI